MGKIIILDENTTNRIAAGEVIERPASIVKELIENSIDAGAAGISAEIKNGGVSLIKVIDNGSGIDTDDVEIAFERHATSKIRNSEDLDSIATLGFRGEALASIAAVSSIEMNTRVSKNPFGINIKIRGGVVQEVKQAGSPIGTVFTIKDLFYNTPARYKFLKKDATEAGYVADIVSRIALGNPGISFSLTGNGASILRTPGNNDLLSTIFSIYGKDIAKDVCELKYDDGKVRISGYAGKAETARTNRNHQSIYINKRYIKNKLISSAIDEAYKTLLMKGRHSFILLNIRLNPLLVDVNVHPSKMEVRFSDEQEIYRHIYHAINNALLNRSGFKTISLGNKIHTQHVEYPVEDNKQEFNVSIKEKEAGYIVPVEKPKEHTPLNGKEGYGKFSRKDENSLFSGKDEYNLPDGKEEHSLFNNMRIIGRAFSTYVLLQNEDELMIVDQHAAHERILYEKIKARMQERESFSQLLINPPVIELSPVEMEIAENEKEFFNKIGFAYEIFGNNSIILRSVPFKDIADPIKETFLDVMDYLISSGKNKMDSGAASDEILYTIACKMAVKAKRKLDDIEIKNILRELDKLKNPYTCPHGRPAAIKITKYELEKMFKRKL